MKIKSILIAGLSMPLCVYSLQAQDNGKKQNGYNENVVVTAPYQPVLGALEKPVSVPRTADTSVVIPPADIQIISRPFVTSYPTENIKPAKVLGEPIPKLFNNSVKLGGGNRGLLVDANFAMGRNRQYEVAGAFRHHSTYGKIKDYDRFTNKKSCNTSLNEADVVGRIFGEKFITALELFYSQRTVNCYGVNNAADTSMWSSLTGGFNDYKNQPKRWFQNARGRLTFTDNAKSFDALRFDATADYNLNLNNWSRNSMENTVILEGGISRVVVQNRRSADMFSIGARVRFEDNMFRDGSQGSTELIPTGNGEYKEIYHKGNKLLNAYHLNFQPTIRFQYEFVELNADMVFHIYGQGEGDGVRKGTKFQFNPVVDLKLHIIPRAFTFFLGTGGGLERNTVDRISRTNPFLHQLYYKNLKFTRDKFNAYAGLSGNFSRNIDYKVQVSAHFMEDVLSFDYYRYDYEYSHTIETKYYGYNDFQPLYSGKVFNLRVRGDLNFCWSEKVLAHVDAEYSHYSQRLYYMPEFTANLDFRYNIVNRVWVYTNLKGYTNMKAKDRTGKDVVLKGCCDWSVGAEYRFIKRMTAFAEINNLLGQRYYRWYDMPSYRWNFMAGISIDF